MIKGPPPVSPSRAFALWLVLLLLYFLLLPSAAKSPERGVEMSASANLTLSQTVSAVPRYRRGASAPLQ